jgi:predicted amidohydrolase
LTSRSNLSGPTEPVGVVLGQVPVVWDVKTNLAVMESVLDRASPQDLVVLPEGMISGYDDELSGLLSLDPAEVASAIVDISRLSRSRSLHVICGTLMFERDAWSNTVVYFSPKGEHYIYRKVNLATHERMKLVAGSQLSIFDVEIAGTNLTVSPQVCRELRFPDQWHYPARRGAQFFAFLSCAANPLESRDVWRSALITRAAETQRYVLAVNVSRLYGNSPTMIVSPRGEVIDEVIDSSENVVRVKIGVSQVSDWYISQQRSDIISIKGTSDN